MRQLNKIENAFFLLGGIMLIIGAMGAVTQFMLREASVVFAMGAFLFSCLQMSQTYQGDSLTIKRLRRIMIISDVCFLLAALLLLENVYHFIMPLMVTSIDGYNAYVHYIYNNWVIPLLIGGILEVYTTLRLSSELKKEGM